MDNNKNAPVSIALPLQNSDMLSLEKINSTALHAMYCAFCYIRANANRDPQKASSIADAFHNFPKILLQGSHEEQKEETLRAIHSLTQVNHSQCLH